MLNSGIAIVTKIFNIFLKIIIISHIITVIWARYNNEYKVMYKEEEEFKKEYNELYKKMRINEEEIKENWRIGEILIKRHIKNNKKAERPLVITLIKSKNSNDFVKKLCNTFSKMTYNMNKIKEGEN